MIERVVIIGFCVFAIYYTMLEGEIFGDFGNWLYDHLPHSLHQPVFDCPICMVPWYGTLIYWAMRMQHGSLKDWLFTIMAAMGFNYILNKFGGSDTIIGPGIDD